MAVTQGHGNPKWTRDETLLALHLYQTLNGQVPGPADQRVIELSRQLQSLPVHAQTDKRDSFRNPAGVAFKLQNIRSVATGQGLGNVSALDRAIWQEYGLAPSAVQQLVDAINTGVASGLVSATDTAEIGDDEEFIEGRILTALHWRRERNPKLRAKFIAKRIVADALRCECCHTGPKAQRHELAVAEFEAHHVVPLSEATAQVTRLSDLVLLCAVCHRLIHQAMRLEKRWVGVDELRGMLASK